MSALVDFGIPKLVHWLLEPPAPLNSSQNPIFLSPKLQVLSNEVSGRGVYASQPVTNSETLVRIPHSFLVNTNTILKHISWFNGREKAPDGGYSVQLPSDKSADEWTAIYTKIPMAEWVEMSAFQRTALYLCTEKKRGARSFWSAFLGTLPHLDELGSAPIVWEIEAEFGGSDASVLLHKLPKSARKHAQKVSARFNADYNAVRAQLVAAKCDPVDKMDFLWAWMCINSRCLYMSFPGAAEADNFTLAPYVDFLNHDCDEKCAIEIDSRGFLVVSKAAHQAGQELCFSYGPHSNEFLLCEYAFTMDSNRWNNLDISHHLEGIMTDDQKAFLADQGYLGDYTVSEHGGISFRTQVALAAIQEREPSHSRRLSLLIQGFNDGETYKPVSRSVLLRVLEEVLTECEGVKSGGLGETGASREKSAGLRLDRERQILRLYLDMEQIAQATLRSIAEW